MPHFNTIYNQLLPIVLLYAQIKAKDGLRDIVTSLKVNSNKWYHIGLSVTADPPMAEKT
jgi:hypothetical protein